MKYLLLIALVLGVLWLMRQARPKMRPPKAHPRTDKAVPTEIVACARCGLHLPRSDALAGTRGLHYCSAAHQREAEGG